MLRGERKRLLTIGLHLDHCHPRLALLRTSRRSSRLLDASAGGSFALGVRRFSRRGHDDVARIEI